MNSKDNVTKKQNNKKRRNPFRFFVFDFVKITGALSVLFWLRPKCLFESKKAKKHVRGGAMVVANHTSIRDPIALYAAFWYRRVHILAMRELFNTKLSNWFFSKVLCIPVDRDNFNMQTFRSVSDALNDNGVVCIFPEGHINSDKSALQSFKSGAVLMAVKSNVQIIPVYIGPYTKWYSRTVMVIGEPIAPQEFCNGTPNIRDLENLSEKLREKELKLMEIYSKWKTRR